MSAFLSSLADLARSRLLRLRAPRSPVDVVLVLHFNQNFVPYLDFVAMGFYARLVSTLRRHPGVPVSLHVSGTALCGLLWFNPPLVEMIRRGVEAGQFELLVSTYAQALPAAVSADEFRLQLDAHRAILAETFGAPAPESFWNPERIHTPELFDLLADEGIGRTFVEDRVLAESLGPARAFDPVVLERGGRRLTLLPDSNAFRSAFNGYLSSGRFFRVEALARSLAAREGGGCLVYAEDAEAFGLWDFERERGAEVDRVFDNLSRALDWFAAQPFVRMRRVSEIEGRGAPLAPRTLPRREPVWIERALTLADERFHEPGYRDWFDFNERSEHLKRHRERQRRVLREIADTLGRRPLPQDAASARAAARMIELARFLFAHHQYEFGCPGLMTGRDVYLNRVAAAVVPVRLLAEGRCRTWRTLVTDIDGDGRDEIVVVHHDFLMVIDREGRLKWLFNLRRGAELTGGFLPTTLTERGEGMNDVARDLRYLDDLWPWLAGRDLGALGVKEYRLRRVKFSDRAGAGEDPPEEFPFAFNDRMTSVYLALFKGRRGDLEARKEYDCAKDTVHLRYRLANTGRASTAVRFEVDAVLAPDYLSVIKKGRRALHFYTETGLLDPGKPLRLAKTGIGVRNEAAGLGVILRFPRAAPTEIEPYEALHALGIRLVWRFDLPPGGEEAFSVAMTAEDL